jgi:hypothetical protein
VGDVSQSSMADWKDEIHQVILNEGELFLDSDVRKFPRLECFLSLRDDGRLILNHGTPDHQEATPYLTPSVSGPGPYKLGITASKRLVIYSEVEGKKREKVWMSEELEKWRL